MFIHDAKIPIRFAHAVHAVMHNQPDDSDWATIDKFAARALVWIETIYTDNCSTWTTKESDWWQEQLDANLEIA
jgi:hypothetical protein